MALGRVYEEGGGYEMWFGSGCYHMLYDDVMEESWEDTTQHCTIVLVSSILPVGVVIPHIVIELHETSLHTKYVSVCGCVRPG